MTFSCSDFNSINFSFACNILSFFNASASILASLRREFVYFFVASKILLAFDFSENLAIINPIIIPTTPTNAGIIIWSIILICLNKKAYNSEVYINSIMTCIELTS